VFIKCCSGGQTKGHLALEEHRNAYRILVGKHEGWGPLGRPRLGREVILKLNLKEM
jgi:hypothetical protein